MDILYIISSFVGILILNYLYYKWIPYFDSYFFGCIYQTYINKGDLRFKGIFQGQLYRTICIKYITFWRWLFHETVGQDGHVMVKRYRVFQKILEGIPNILIFLFIYFNLKQCGDLFALGVGILNLICILFSHYYMVYDYKYYELLDEIDYAKTIVIPYWLMRGYFLGKLIFNPYEYNLFKLSANFGKLYLLIVPIIILVYKIVN